MADTLLLINQFGEESKNSVKGGTSPVSSSAANTVLSNLTGSAAAPLANTYAQFLAGVKLTGLVAGTNVAISATDSVIVALAKLQAQIDAL